MGCVGRSGTPGFVDDSFQDSAGDNYSVDGRRRYIGTTVNMRLVRTAFALIVLALMAVVARTAQIARTAPTNRSAELQRKKNRAIYL